MDTNAAGYARFAIAATIFFFVVMFIAFLFIQPELNPLHRFGSEYAAGRAGWLMKLNFYVWGGGLFAFAVAMAKGLDADAKSRVAIVLFMLAGVAIFIGGIFDSDLQVQNQDPPPRWIEPSPSNEQILHAAAGLVAFFGLMSGAGLVSRRLRVAGRLSGSYLWLRPLSWLMPGAFIAMATVFHPHGFAGLGQRIFLVLAFTWVILAARGLAKGAFVPHQQLDRALCTPSQEGSA